MPIDQKVVSWFTNKLIDVHNSIGPRYSAKLLRYRDHMVTTRATNSLLS
jgi:hypothetical protein